MGALGPLEAVLVVVGSSVYEHFTVLLTGLGAHGTMSIKFRSSAVLKTLCPPDPSFGGGAGARSLPRW